MPGPWFDPSLFHGDPERERHWPRRRILIWRGKVSAQQSDHRRTNREAAEIFISVVTEHSVEELEDILMNATLDAPQAEVVPLADYFADLRARGFKTGVVTNDTEAGAMSHLRPARATKHLDFIAGFDSGYGAKPALTPFLHSQRA